MVWENYMSPCNSIAGLYFKGTCDVISVTMARFKVRIHGAILRAMTELHPVSTAKFFKISAWWGSFPDFCGETSTLMEKTESNLAQRNGSHWNRLIFLKLSIIIFYLDKEESAITEKFNEIFWLPYEQQMQVAVRRCPLCKNYSHYCMENKFKKLSYISSDIYDT